MKVDADALPAGILDNVDVASPATDCGAVARVVRFGTRPCYGMGSPAATGVTALAAGTWITNVHPLPGMLWTSISPP